jgi:carboxymethylenebutenolidase
MTDGKKDQKRDDDESLSGLTRRDFVALSVAAGLAAATGSAASTELPVIETNVDVKTPDGTCDAVFIHPMKGCHPGVLVWHDSPGLRPVVHDLGKRIAAEGYSALVPNLFYRTARAPVFDVSFDYANNPADREKYRRTVASFLAPGAAERRCCLRSVPGRATASEQKKRRSGHTATVLAGRT